MRGSRAARAAKVLDCDAIERAARGIRKAWCCRSGGARSRARKATGAPVEGLEKYAETSEPDDYRQRMINNVLAFVFCILLVAAGVWLADRDRRDAQESGLRAVGPAELRAM